MTIRSLRQRLLGTSAFVLIALSVPAFAQSTLSDRSTATAPSKASGVKKSSDVKKSSEANRSSDANRMNAAGNAGDWNRNTNRSPAWQTYSDDRNFSKVYVAAASDLVGRTLSSDDGGASGDVEYILIEPTSGKVMYLLVGMGGWFDVDQKLAIVPFEAVNITREVYGGNEVDDLRLTLRASFNRLRTAPTLSDSALSDLTSPKMQVAVRNFWMPLSAAESGQSPSVDAATGASRTSTDPAAGAEPLDREANSQSGDQSAGTQSAGTQSADPRSGDLTSGDMNRRSNNAAPADTARPDSSPQSGSKSASAAEGGSSRSASTSDSAGNADSTSIGADVQRTYTLVARSYITALAPPAVMRPDQLRGATVTNRDGQEIGSIDKLIIDLQRGHVAYALVAEGGFLGIGETWRPVPLQALRWQEGETFALPVSGERLQAMPSLKDNQLPGSVRRTHLERLYNSYGTNPYWQQARSGDRSNDRTAGNRSESRPERGDTAGGDNTGGSPRGNTNAGNASRN